MKHLYLTLLSLFGLSAAAQTLPNAEFNDWETCYPWTSTNTSTSQGQTPSYWTISHVASKEFSMASVEFTDVKKTDGTNTYAYLANKNVVGNNIPAYMCLGKTWSTTKASIFSQTKKDGGSFGGYAFTHRPDALKFKYMKTGTNDYASVVAYMWKGTFKQDGVPGNIAGSPTTCTMTDRDRNVLGMTTAEGGSVSATGTLIARFTDNIYKINEVKTAWTTAIVPFEYVNGETPEKINVIFSAGNYFATASEQKNNISLSVDKVELLYYSKLEDVKVGGTTIAGFSKDVYNYTIDATLPAESAVTYTLYGPAKAATVTKTVDTANNRITLRVASVGVDENGETSHTYTLQFNAPVTEPEVAVLEDNVYNGVITVTLPDTDPEDMPDSDVHILTMDNGTYTFALYDFLDSDVVVPNCTMSKSGSNKVYTGSIDQIALMDGAVNASAVVEATLEPSGKLTAYIHVIWYQEWEDGSQPKPEGCTEIPIEVVFNGQGAAGIGSVIADDANAPVEYFNIQGMKVNADNLTNGIYIRRQGSKATKVIVK